MRENEIEFDEIEDVGYLVMGTSDIQQALKIIHKEQRNIGKMLDLILVPYIP